MISRTHLALAGLALAAAVPAVAGPDYSPSKKGQYPSTNFNAPDVDKLTIHGTGSTGEIPNMTVGGRPLSGLLSAVPQIENGQVKIFNGPVLGTIGPDGKFTLTPDSVTAPSFTLTGPGLTGPIDSGTVGGTAIPAILGSKAPLVSPTFSGTVTAPSFTGGADALTVGGATLPSVLGTKAPLANPIFSGTVTAPTVSVSGAASVGSLSTPGAVTAGSVTGDGAGITVGGTAIPAILGSKAPLASPSFSGTVTAPGISLNGSGLAGPIDSGTVGGTAVPTLLGAKAPLASPTFSGTVTAPALSVSGAAGVGSLTAAGGISAGTLTGDGAGVTVGGATLPSILGTKAPLAAPTFTGAVTAPSLSLTGSGLAGPIDSGTVGGTAIPAILDTKAPLANPTFSGTVAAPALSVSGAASIGSLATAGAVTAGSLTGDGAGVTVGGATLPSVLGSKAPLASPTFTGTVKAPTFAGIASAMTTRATGALIDRTLADRAAEVVNASDYFTCDGVTDIRAGLAAAIAAAVPKPLYIPPQTGACLVSSFVNIKTGLVIYATRGTVTFKQTPGNTDDPWLFSGVGVTDVAVRGLTIDGGGRDHANSGAVARLFLTTRITFTDTDWTSIRGSALLASNSSAIGVIGSTFTDIGNHWRTTGVRADRLAALVFCCNETAPSVGNYVRDSQFTDIGLDAINGTNQARFSAERNTCTWTYTQSAVISLPDYPACVYMHVGEGAVISGNSAINPPGNGYDVDKVNRAVISANSVTGAGGGILYTGDFGVITGNLVTNGNRWAGNATPGSIALGQTRYTSVTGNSLGDDQNPHTQKYCIWGSSGADRTGTYIDQSNTCFGAASGTFGGGITAYGAQ